MSMVLSQGVCLGLVTVVMSSWGTDIYECCSALNCFCTVLATLGLQGLDFGFLVSGLTVSVLG